MININYFTYKDDEDILIYSIKILQNSFKNQDYQIHVIDEDKNPISDDVKDVLSEIGVKYRQSTFERNGNLNGKEACIGIIEELQKSSDNSKEGISIKIDCDTMIINPEMFITLNENKFFLYAGLNQPNFLFSGMCYAIKNNILDDIKEMLNCLPPKLEDKTAYPEDLTIGAIISILCGKSDRFLTSMSWSKEFDNGTVCGWNYDNEITDEGITYYINKFDIITMGNWFLYYNKSKKDRIVPMERILNLIK